MTPREEALESLLAAWPLLGPYQDRVVVVGGIAVHLYHLVPGFSVSRELEAMATVDVDLGLPRPMDIIGEKPLLEYFRDQGLSPYFFKGELVRRRALIFQSFGPTRLIRMWNFFLLRWVRIPGMTRYSPD